jgi:hypothetical protein
MGTNSHEKWLKLKQNTCLDDFFCKAICVQNFVIDILSNYNVDIFNLKTAAHFRTKIDRQLKLQKVKQLK